MTTRPFHDGRGPTERVGPDLWGRGRRSVSDSKIFRERFGEKVSPSTVPCRRSSKRSVGCPSVTRGEGDGTWRSGPKEEKGPNGRVPKESVRSYR